MGFFSDLKEDLSQAVNELIPEEAENAEQQRRRKRKKKNFSLLQSMRRTKRRLRSVRMIWHSLTRCLQM